MAVNFPDSPSNGDTTVINGATYTWDGVKWDTTSFASNVTATYDSPLNLPTTGLTNGDVAWVGGSTNKLYISNGTGWLSATLTNSAPVINSVQDASAGTTPFSLATDGTPTVITIDATDPESFGLTYSYSVTSGALGTTATVSQADNVFTITPGTNDPADVGTFELTFSVYDGVNTVTSVNEFTLAFTAMYGDRGLFAGGNTPSASNAVEYIDITTASDAATFGTLSTGIAHGGTASNGTIGIFYGINANTAASNRDYFTIPSNPGAVTASEAGALSTGRKEPGSAGDGTYGTFAGSVPTSSNSNTTLDSIEYITIATTSAGATFANLSATTGSLAGASDGTNAYYFGGYNYNLTSNWDNKRIETLVIATQGQQSSFGNLANDRYNHSAAGNETYGVIAGGGPDGTQTPNSTIERIAYATQTTATSFGSLNGGGRWKNGSLNNETYAIFAGGYTLGPDTYYGTMNFVTIDGAGGSSAFGNLGTNRGDGVRGLSGSPA